MNTSTVPTTNDAAGRVIKEIANVLCIDETQIKPDTNLIADLGADSLDAVEVCMALEDEFSIEITDEEAVKLKTVQDYIDIAQNKTSL